ncbi:oxidoreductase NAD-binding domain-containing protein 1-like [Macrobrachium nipponense]|uniref:oxidoreductase NAD-binding domain-containing protein 1-like n=1 Tax=Macrobrachium nipponense TaxID=159736 RepID=UPI0030C7A196
MEIMTLGGPGIKLALRGLRLKHTGIIRFLSTAPPKLEAQSGLPNGGLGAGKHLQFTAKHSRLPVIVKAVVTDVRLESPTVRGITLQIDNPQFNFKAGQWVDMFIPGMETVGGFSMYSAPSQLIETGTIDLGIKFSKWPPVFWIHTQCKVGSTVALRVGGDFYYAPEVGDHPFDLLLVAGGVGVNPLASMYFHARTLHKLYLENKEEYCPGKVLLLYSAKTYEDILYKTLLDAISSFHPGIEVKYFTTREPPPHASNATYGHITQDVLRSSLKTLDTSALQTFVCGPPPMIENIKDHLLVCGLSQNKIFYEKWW